MEVKHQYFSQFLSIVTWGGVPLEMKSCLPFAPWVRSLRWIFSSQVIYFSWKLTAVSGVSFFDRTMAFPSESEWALFRRNAPCQKAIQLMRYSLYIHTYLLLAFAFSCRLQYHAQPHITWEEPGEIATDAGSFFTDITGSFATDCSRVMNWNGTRLPLDSWFN